MQRVIMKSRDHRATMSRAAGFEGSCVSVRVCNRVLRHRTSTVAHADARNGIVEQAAIA